MKKNIFIVGFSILVIILLVILVKVEKAGSRVIEVNYSDLSTKMAEYQEGLIYVPSTNEDSTLVDFFKEEYKIKVLKTKMTLTELSDLIKSSDLDIDVKLPMFIIFDEGKVIGGFEAEITETEANEMFRYYYFNEIPSKMIYYKTLSTADEYIKKVNSNDLTVAVFGYDACSYCNLYKPVFNKVAKDYNLNIYYFDSDKYNEEEYTKILDLDLTIPASCTVDGNETSLKNGFPKPMTLVTKKGKLVGCIKGYVNEDSLVKKLKEFKVLESGK
jgi:thiol-disulfide isomerase/thioredoxin